MVKNKFILQMEIKKYISDILFLQKKYKEILALLGKVHQE